MKKRLISAALASVMALSTLPSAFAANAGLSNFERTKTYTDGQFTDVSAAAWYAEYVKDAFELDLVSGNSDTTFNPNGNLTIAEAVVLACNLHNIYYAEGKEFTQGNPWYQVYVDYAVEKGIISAGAYSSYTASATRAQFAQILNAALPDDALRAINTITSIPDVSASSSEAWAKAVYCLYNAGVISGNDKYGTFAPKNTIKRSEVAKIVTLMADASLRTEFTLAEKPPEGGTLSNAKVQEICLLAGSEAGVASVAQASASLSCMSAQMSAEWNFNRYFSAKMDMSRTIGEAIDHAREALRLYGNHVEFSKPRATVDQIISLYRKIQSNAMSDVAALEACEPLFDEAMALWETHDEQLKKIQQMYR